MDAITGLTKSPSTKERYNLYVEPGLAERIANDLLDDDEVSSVAPVLQILLTEMWNKAKKENPGQPSFTLDVYRKLSREGIHLNDFSASTVGDYEEAISNC